MDFWLPILVVHVMLQSQLKIQGCRQTKKYILLLFLVPCIVFSLKWPLRQFIQVSAMTVVCLCVSPCMSVCPPPHITQIGITSLSTLQCHCSRSFTCLQNPGVLESVNSCSTSLCSFLFILSSDWSYESLPQKKKILSFGHFPKGGKGGSTQIPKCWGSFFLGFLLDIL